MGQFQAGNSFGQGRPKKDRNVTYLLENQNYSPEELKGVLNWSLAQALPETNLNQFKVWNDVAMEANTFGLPKPLKFGFKTVDDHTLGFSPGDYIIIGAPTGEGKTQFATYVANHNASVDQKVLYMSREERAEGVKARLARTSSSQMFDNIRFPITDSLNADNVVEIIEHFADAGGQIVIVDYIQAFCRGSHSVDKVAALSEKFRDIARLRNIVIIGLAQVNRSGYKNDNGPGIENLYNSSTLEHDACSILLLWRNDRRLLVKLGKTRNLDLARIGGDTVALRTNDGYIVDDWRAYAKSQGLVDA